MDERYLTSFEDQTSALSYTSGDTTLVSPQVSLIGSDDVVYSKKIPNESKIRFVKDETTGKLCFVVDCVSYVDIDLGLPSGTIWADRNVGSTSPEDTGLYFSWGNVDGHAVDENGNVADGYSFDENTYATTLGSQYTGSTLDTEHDAATVNMGEYWRTPTLNEWQELIQNTTQIFIDIHGNEYKKGIDTIKIGAGEFKGVRFESSTGSIFIPASGYCDGSLRKEFQQRCRTWSAIANGGIAKYMYFSSSGSMHTGYSESRHYGRTIRSVHA